MVKCSQCGKDNKGIAKFCTGCGTKLDRHCPQCGAMTTREARFCSACGTSLAATGSGLVQTGGQNECLSDNVKPSMTKEEAFNQLNSWYEECVETGIEPEEIVSMMGGMALVTDEELVGRLQDAGVISSY